MKRIFLVLCMFVFAALSAHAEKCLSYYNSDHTILNQDAGIFVQLSVKVTVSNRCYKSILGAAEFKATSNDFLIASKPFLFTLKDGETKVLSDLWYIKKGDYEKIDNIRFEENFER